MIGGDVLYFALWECDELETARANMQQLENENKANGYTVPEQDGFFTE